MNYHVKILSYEETRERLLDGERALVCPEHECLCFNWHRVRGDPQALLDLEEEGGEVFISDPTE